MVEQKELILLKGNILTALFLLQGGYLSQEAFTQPSKTDSSVVRVGKFVDAVALAVDPTGQLYVADAGTNEIVKISASGKVLARSGGYPKTDQQLGRPGDIVAGNGIDVYVIDQDNRQILRFDKNLNFVSRFPDTQGSIVLRNPQSLALTRFGDLLIAERGSDRILQVSRDRSTARDFIASNTPRGLLRSPERIRIDKEDVVTIIDGKRIVQFDVFGNYIRTINQPREHVPQIVSFNGSHYGILTDSCTLTPLSVDSTLSSSYTIGKDFCDQVIDAAIVNDTAFVLTRQAILKFYAGD